MMQDLKHTRYIAPQTEYGQTLYPQLIATSPTGEDYTDPEEYNGF